MYEDRLGTDWEALSEAEAIDRAFALGVASVFGYENREEFGRLRAALDNSYDRSIIDLAYQEGKQKARELRGTGPDRTEVWNQLVEDEPDDESADRGRNPPHPSADRGPAGKLTETIDRIDLIEGGTDLEALQYPRFLGTRPDDRDGRE